MTPQDVQAIKLALDLKYAKEHADRLLALCEHMVNASPEFLIELRQQLTYVAKSCPCGARSESPSTHPHVPGCPIERVLHEDIVIPPRPREITHPQVQRIITAVYAYTAASKRDDGKDGRWTGEAREAWYALLDALGSETPTTDQELQTQIRELTARLEVSRSATGKVEAAFEAGWDAAMANVHADGPARYKAYKIYLDEGSR